MTRAGIFRITLVSDNLFLFLRALRARQNTQRYYTPNRLIRYICGLREERMRRIFRENWSFFSLSKKYTQRVSFCWSLWWRTWMQIIWICSQLPRILALWLVETRNGASSSSEPRTRVYKDFGGLHLYRWITISLSRWVILQS